MRWRNRESWCCSHQRYFDYHYCCQRYYNWLLLRNRRIWASCRCRPGGCSTGSSRCRWCPSSADIAGRWWGPWCRYGGYVTEGNNNCYCWLMMMMMVMMMMMMTGFATHLWVFLLCITPWRARSDCWFRTNCRTLIHSDVFLSLMKLRCYCFVVVDCYYYLF